MERVWVAGYSTEALSNMNGGGQLRCRKREKEATEPIFSKILFEVCLKANLLFLAIVLSLICSI